MSVEDERGREVVCVVRPGKEPTHDTPRGGRTWHYLTPDGQRVRAFLYHYPAGSSGRKAHGLAGWRAEVGIWLSSGNTIPEPWTRPRVQAWAEERLREAGVEVVDAAEAALRTEAVGPGWWLEKKGGGR